MYGISLYSSKVNVAWRLGPDPDNVPDFPRAGGRPYG